MSERSRQVSPENLERVRKRLRDCSLNQAALAEDLKISRSTVSKFFTGKSVDRECFEEICEKLDFEWEEVVAQPPEQLEETRKADIDQLVQATREKIKPIIHEKCGTMRVLDMEQPIELTGDRGIYTTVNILERISGRRRLEIAELVENCGGEEFDRFGLSQISDKRVPGLKAVSQHSKLMMLGKPGAGKTTFLKYLAMQCIEGLFQPERVPFFITLKDFAETREQFDLLRYVDRVVEAPILKAGRALVLLDGLDEVREEDTGRVLQQIREFSEQFHTNPIVITCRIAAKEYTFERFTEVEVADFDETQIASFAQNWFRLSDPTKAERFIQKLKENKPVQELASSPLLLTLLCLMFGETADFPANRSELYKEGLDVLLKKWDAKRNIERDQIYKNLSLQRKEDLLSQIALTTFSQNDYFFKQKTVEAYIADFMRNLQHIDPDPEALRSDSEAILRSIEAQHGLLVERAKGIYSFSHLTFQEYFTAREIVETQSTGSLQQLTEQIIEKRWREVFLLTAGMMRNANDLMQLMKQQIDGLVASDPELQHFLSWVSQKSHSVEASYKPTAIRAFYLALGRALARALAHALDRVRALRALALALDLALDLDRVRDIHALALALALALARALARALDLHLDRALHLAHAHALDLHFDRALNLAHARALDRALHLAHARALDRALAHALDRALDLHLDRDLAHALDLDLEPELQRRLQELKDQLPDASYENREAFRQWWQVQGQAWTKQLRAIMIEHRNIGHDWQFNDEQQQKLQQYYDANRLLVDCLNSDCYVSREVRQEIEETLLLPIAEIEQRKLKRD
jgi:predicted NACHT family NTPase